MNDSQRLTQVKMALTATTATAGWAYVKQIADNVVSQAKDSILDAATAEAREEAALKATALRNGLRDIFNAVEAAKHFDAGDDWLAGYLDPEQSEVELNG